MLHRYATECYQKLWCWSVRGDCSLWSPWYYHLLCLFLFVVKALEMIVKCRDKIEWANKITFKVHIKIGDILRCNKSYFYNVAWQRLTEYQHIKNSKSLKNNLWTPIKLKGSISCCVFSWKKNDVFFVHIRIFCMYFFQCQYSFIHRNLDRWLIEIL